MDKAKILFTKEISSEKVLEMYKLIGKELTGNVAVKVHTGEKGNINFLHPDFWKPTIDFAGGRVVETNTAYGDARGGVRDHTDSHRKLIEYHGWSQYYDVDIMDEDGPDVRFEIPEGEILKENFVGKNLLNYDSMLVLAHFKGHPAGGFGGALKQLAIGCASSKGKALIHSGGVTDDHMECWNNLLPPGRFQIAMADAAATVARYLDGNAVYINVMKNLSVDCDCLRYAVPPCMEDIGILASTDPLAIDKACIDLIYASDDPGRDTFLERVHSRGGEAIFDEAERLGIGSLEYELVEV